MDLTAIILAAFNTLLAAVLSILSYRVWRRRRAKPWGWLILSFVLIGVYWAAVYFVVMVGEIAGTYDAAVIGRIWIRPAITLTFALMVAELLYRVE